MKMEASAGILGAEMAECVFGYRFSWLLEEADHA
jgi:hypothetical protein